DRTVTGVQTCALPIFQDDIAVKLFLCGDVMTGRGIDQALPHSVNPVLYERYIRDAHAYVELAEAANGPIPRPVGFDYIWGDALRSEERRVGKGWSGEV